MTYVDDDGGMVTETCLYHCAPGRPAPCEGADCECGCHRSSEPVRGPGGGLRDVAGRAVRPRRMADQGAAMSMWPRLLAGGEIDHAAWLRARAEGSPLGGCRRKGCGGMLMPESPVDRKGGTDYESTCNNCGGVVVAPAGRVVHGTSALWSESDAAKLRKEPRP